VPVGLLALVAALLPTTGAVAGPPPAVVADTIVVTDVISSVTPPATPGAPADLIVTSGTFSVEVELRKGDTKAPHSATKDTLLRIAVTQGVTSISSGAASATAVVTANTATATFTGLALGTAANGVQLTVSPASTKVTLERGATPVFEVYSNLDTPDVSGVQPGAALSVSRKGVSVPCQATVSDPTCIDLLLPASDTGGRLAGGVFFAEGVCDLQVACLPGRELQMVLAAFTYDRTAPATIIHKCDRSACGGGGVPSKKLWVSLESRGPLTEAKPCTAKGIVVIDQPASEPPAEFCVDYAQSKRDGAGDLHLYLLLTRDARMSSP
jgi:hypothetical protein